MEDIIFLTNFYGILSKKKSQNCQGIQILSEVLFEVFDAAIYWFFKLPRTRQAPRNTCMSQNWIEIKMNQNTHVLLKIAHI